MAIPCRCRDMAEHCLQIHCMRRPGAACCLHSERQPGVTVSAGCTLHMRPLVQMYHPMMFLPLLTHAMLSGALKQASSHVLAGVCSSAAWCMSQHQLLPPSSGIGGAGMQADGRTNWQAVTSSNRSRGHRYGCHVQAAEGFQSNLHCAASDTGSAWAAAREDPTCKPRSLSFPRTQIPSHRFTNLISGKLWAAQCGKLAACNSSRAACLRPSRRRLAESELSATARPGRRLAAHHRPRL